MAKIKMRRLIVISAVNIREGGAAKILDECIDSIRSSDYSRQLKFVLICQPNLRKNYSNVHCICHYAGRLSWLKRLWIEYVVFWYISKRLKPFGWVSLHDVTPNVIAKQRMVYCHNPAPFLNPTLRDIISAPDLLIFKYAYSLLYRINVKKNKRIIVQQIWLGQYFKKFARDVPILINRPSAGSTMLSNNGIREIVNDQPNTPSYDFLFPSFPRAFKNFETICTAVSLLEEILPSLEFRLLLTIKGDENSYARWVHRKFSSSSKIVFLGQLNRNEMAQVYSDANCVLFPSRLETWGLPISEAIGLKLPLIVADLPYARETAGKYSNIHFCETRAPQKWAEAMARQITGSTTRKSDSHGSNLQSQAAQTEFPEAGWDCIWKIMAQ